MEKCAQPIFNIEITLSNVNSMIYPAQAQLEIYLSTSIYNNIKLKKYIKKINKQVVRQLHAIISSSWI